MLEKNNRREMFLLIIRFEFIGDENLICIPDTVPWRIVCKFCDNTGYDDYGLYLILNGEEIQLRDAETLCSGRNIPLDAVGELHYDMINEISKKLIETPKTEFICLEDLESDLLKSKYEELWISKGYIHPDKNGAW